MGNDPRNMSSDTLMILSNKEAIAVNQDPLGVQGTLRANYSVNHTMITGPVVAVQCNPSIKTQHWLFDKTTGVIKDTGTETCLDAGSGHGQVYVQTCDNSTQQQWLFDNTFPYLQPKSISGMCLDVYNFQGPVVQLYPCKTNGGENQNQEFQFDMDGTLRPNISNMCLDVQASGEIQIWAGPLQNNSYAAVLLNKDTMSHDIKLLWSDIGLDENDSYTVRDLWQHKDMGTFKGSYVATGVEGHGVAMLTLMPQKAEILI
jgi:hypothetical protein